jgi:hypothetical protein
MSASSDCGNVQDEKLPWRVGRQLCGVAPARAGQVRSGPPGAGPPVLNVRFFPCFCSILIHYRYLSPLSPLWHSSLSLPPCARALCSDPVLEQILPRSSQRPVLLLPPFPLSRIANHALELTPQPQPPLLPAWLAMCEKGEGGRSETCRNENVL